MEEVIISNSSTIRKIAYDHANLTLYVTFKQGTVYKYERFPAVMWKEFKNAPSKGQFFVRSIKGKFNNDNTRH